MDDPAKLKEQILAALRGSEDGRTMDVKKLRKLILLQNDAESDKDNKKLFKQAVQSLEKDTDQLKVKEDGTVKLDKKQTTKYLKSKERKSKKRSKDDEHEADDDTKKQKLDEENEPDNNVTGKNIPCKGNPQGTTRLFLGNLPFAIDENSLKEFFEGHSVNVTHIKWITDKETGRFYGSAFVEVLKSIDGATAVSQVNGLNLLGRPIKINFAPAREGDVWPPKNSVVTGGKQQAGGAHNQKVTGGQAQGSGIQSLPPQPEGCVKLFIGNLSYDIDDDTLFKFFDSVEAEVKAVRWLSHKDTGDFKGVGFVEFWNTEACAKAASLNGKNLLGRPIRIDWTD